MVNGCSGTWLTHRVGTLASHIGRPAMPWNEVSAMSLRLEFVTLATAEGANVRELCRRFAISPPTAYKWIARHKAAGPDAMKDRPRRPIHSPRRSPEAVEAEVLRLRDAHPAWGGRKLRARLIAL